MPFVSAKSILTSINILDEEDVNRAKQKKRHPKNEFQAFAYKLSKDLNDDKNLTIYMRLAKTVDRSLMEQAYSFAVDSNSQEKGRLFLWKLKQLRADLQKIRNKKNFSYEFVSKQMSKFRENLADQTIQKSTNWQSKEFYEEIFNFLNQTPKLGKDKNKILSIGPNTDEIFGFTNTKFESIELSKKVVSLLKEKKRKEKIIGKDFLKNSYTNEAFDIVIVNSYWQFLPLESELKFLSEIKRVLKKDGLVIINHKESLEDTQEWKALISNNLELEYFIKNETNHTFRTVVEKCEFKVDKEIMSGSYIVYFLKNHNADQHNNADD